MPWGSPDWSRQVWREGPRREPEPLPSRSAAAWVEEIKALEVVHSDAVVALGTAERRRREAPDSYGHLGRECEKVRAAVEETKEKLATATAALATVLAARPQPSEEEVRELRLEICVVAPDLLPGMLVIEKLVALRKKAEELLGEEHPLVADLPWERLPEAARLIAGFMESAGARLTEEKQ